MSARASDCENIVFCKWLKSYAKIRRFSASRVAGEGERHYELLAIGHFAEGLHYFGSPPELMGEYNER
jgi:hypothetical protein